MNDYIEDRLAGRRIFWCPGGQGNLAYCPQPTNPDDYTFCCTYYYLSQDMPTCCRWPWHTGAMIALLFSGILLTLVLAFFTCWCCPCCPLAKRLMENQELRSQWEEATITERMATQQTREDCSDRLFLENEASNSH